MNVRRSRYTAASSGHRRLPGRTGRLAVRSERAVVTSAVAHRSHSLAAGALIS
ncbi:MAG TPA: hypothetical protein VMF12_20065 [Xanthobacteraceae bacterium]|nr:hypothetical protein [Xanthobacteraceae bacterium]